MLDAHRCLQSQACGAEEHRDFWGEKKINLEEQRLVEKMVQNGTRAGLGFPEEEREWLNI